ncbi:ferredoxin [Nocardia otitidiscaviarum]|uniref:ferredoxin n=1 Tax=Nocardia otitidiscaviarum TaxID=1823 RepID=UPI0004A72E53|nr:ferredoxin [Nocardia otitidiscaviarum]MBF6136977.1 ferredoxin [Nocardia otitidiscaviarum]MBF6485177.1 ferredoxin [Nocardia otitidiscaviarum]
MKITVDYDRCEGHGLCAEQAPAVFSLDDDAELTYRFEGADVPGDEVAAAQTAIVSCPVAALRASS